MMMQWSLLYPSIINIAMRWVRWQYLILLRGKIIVRLSFPIGTVWANFHARGAGFLAGP